MIIMPSLHIYYTMPQGSIMQNRYTRYKLPVKSWCYCLHPNPWTPDLRNIDVIDI
jgi:hypothetical protein